MISFFSTVFAVIMVICMIGAAYNATAYNPPRWERVSWYMLYLYISTVLFMIILHDMAVHHG